MAKFVADRLHKERRRTRTDKSKAMLRNARVSKRKIHQPDVEAKLTSTGDWIH